MGQVESPSQPLVDEVSPQPAAILVVDDDAPILEAVADILQIQGYHVVTAVDGVTGLARLHDFRPDLIISDIMMPDMDGYQFFEMVRRNPTWITIPFMFLTAKGQKTDIRYGYEIGADDFIVKPFETEDLIVKVAVRIKRSRDIQSAARESVERMKEQLLTIFGHELRTPLTYIYGYANLLKDSHGSLDQESIDQMLAGIHLGAERLVRLTESLLMMVRIDSGTIAAEITHRSCRVSLRSVLNEALGKLSEALDAAGVVVDVKVPDTLDIQGVEYLLSDAFVRLLDNALHYCKPGSGQIQVASAAEDGHVTVSIIDNGIGIAPENHQRIFERFVQVDRDAMEQQGIGLGLSIARSLVRLHGGDIQVASRLGAGSTFNIIFPVPDPLES